MAKLKFKGVENTDMKQTYWSPKDVSTETLLSVNTKGEVYINPKLKIKK